MILSFNVGNRQEIYLENLDIKDRIFQNAAMEKDRERMDINGNSNKMNYKDFKNKHKDNKIIVCGCGESVLQLKDKNLTSIITVAVNDFSRLQIPDYLVVVNAKGSFKGDRWQWIENTQCMYIFTHLDKLEVPEEKKILFKLGRYG